MFEENKTKIIKACRMIINKVKFPRKDKNMQLNNNKLNFNVKSMREANS